MFLILLFCLCYLFCPRLVLWLTKSTVIQSAECGDHLVIYIVCCLNPRSVIVAENKNPSPPCHLAVCIWN